MAKRRPARRHRPTPAAEPRLHAPGAGLAAAMEDAAGGLIRLAGAAQTDPLARRFALDELVGLAQSIAAALVKHRQELLAAVEIDQTATPLASTYPSGELWSGPQRPRYLAGLARRAGEDPQPVTYVERLADAAVAADLDPACPHPTADGGRCHGQRARLAARRRAEACWTHLSADRKSQIRADRDQAVAAHHCRSCDAPAGTPCRDRSGRPTQPHTARLDDLLASPAGD